MKKIKFSLGAIAMLFAISAAFAFNAPVKKGDGTLTRFHYTSSSSLLADMQNINNWVEENPTCGPGGTKPCAIDINGDLSDLDAQLDTYTSASQVTAAASKTKQ